MKRSPQLPDRLLEGDGSKDHGRGGRGGTGPDEPETGSGRGWRIVAWVLSALAVASLAGTAWLLFGPAGSAPAGGKVLACVQSRDFTKGAKRRCPPKGADFVDGLVGKDEDGSFSLTTMQGQTRKLLVREPDRPYVDIAHAQSHAQFGQPVRVYTRRYHGKDVVIFMEDVALP